MTTNEKQNKQPEAGKKELTPRQIQMRKKMVVFPLFFLAFAGCMWLIFSPGEKEREEPSAGFNTALPTPESEGILSDKRDAYVQGAGKDALLAGFRVRDGGRGGRARHARCRAG